MTRRRKVKRIRAKSRFEFGVLDGVAESAALIRTNHFGRRPL
jgi:hypothetical protein